MDPSGIVYANMFSGMDWAVVALLALLFFGGKKVGDLGKGLGEGIRNFKTALKSDDEQAKIEEKKQA
jgi:sec-independent protein translocase protein TatA